MDYKEESRLGREAAILKDNKLLKRFFGEVKTQLDTKQLNTHTTDKETLADIARCHQILAGLEQAMQNCINNGKVADHNLREIMKQPTKKIINRGW